MWCLCGARLDFEHSQVDIRADNTLVSQCFLIWLKLVFHFLHWTFSAQVHPVGFYLRISTSHRIEALYAVSLSAVADNGTPLSYKQSQPKQKQVWIDSIEIWAHAWLGILIVWMFAILSTLAHVQPHSVRYQLMTLSSQCLTGVSDK